MAAIDISFTVLERVRQGRRLMRDLSTGQVYWEPAEVPVQTEAHLPAAPAPSPTVVESKTKSTLRKPRRRKQSEGDK